VKNLNTNNKNKRKLLDINFLSRTKKFGNDKIIIKNQELFNFSSNDYLGLSKNPYLSSVSKNWIREFGTSLSSSRLVSGNLEDIKFIETDLSKLTKNPETLIMSSGFQTNATLIPAIIGNSLGERKKTFIFSDKLNHASINFGCSFTNQRVFRYSHLDMNHLEYLIKKVPKNSQKILISETVFSMDGDVLDIESIRFLAKKYNCFLYLDEAHALGVFGEKGFGLSSNKKKIENEIIVGTFGKAFGSFGSFVSCSKENKEKIINSCGGLIYSTVLPPSVLGSIKASVEIMPKLSKLRKRILENSKFLIERLKKINIDVGNSSSHIIPLIFGDQKECNNIRDYLVKNSFFVKAIYPPTVPIGGERIRLSITATMPKHLISKLLDLISKYKTL